MDGGILTVSGTMAVNESVEKHLSKVFGPDWKHTVLNTSSMYFSKTVFGLELY